MFSLLTHFLFFILKCILCLVAFYVLFFALLILIVKTKQKDRAIRILTKPKKLPLHINFLRWIVVDLLRGKQYPVWGIYMFVAKPGNGKTISMTEHIVRVKKEHPEIKVYTNFNYRGQDGVLSCWQDIVNAPDNSMLAIDELHMLASSSNYQDFPFELLGEITQNRHSRKQFITSTQDYDLINVNFKRVCNYVVLCKNVWGFDRLFKNYYFDRGIYESKGFLPNRAKCNFTRSFVASDETYARYDTLEKITAMVKEIENADVTGTLKRLKELKQCTELQSKEQKYINGIIDRINLDMENRDKWDAKDKEIEYLKEELHNLKMGFIA